MTTLRVSWLPVPAALLALGLGVAAPAPAGAAAKTKAASGEARVRAMLATNPVVKAAVAEARRFAGARGCATQVKATQPPEFEPGTTFDYAATITCTADESSGIVEVRGRLSGEGPQALTLKLDFAG